MNKTKKNSKNDLNPINMLHDIENVDSILTGNELKKINELFNSIENFNQITEQLETVIIKNTLTEYDIKFLFYSIKKIVNHKIMSDEEKPVMSKKKLGFAQTFFELPEIISRRLSLDKSC